MYTKNQLINGLISRGKKKPKPLPKTKRKITSQITKIEIIHTVGRVLNNTTSVSTDL